VTAHRLPWKAHRLSVSQVKHDSRRARLMDLADVRLTASSACHARHRRKAKRRVPRARRETQSSKPSQVTAVASVVAVLPARRATSPPPPARLNTDLLLICRRHAVSLSPCHAGAVLGHQALRNSHLLQDSVQGQYDLPRNQPSLTLVNWNY
jgi:hypothetical protein